MVDINKPQDPKQASPQTGAIAGETARQSAHAAQQGVRAAGDVARQGAAFSADVTQRSAEAAHAAVRQASETTTETLQRNTKAFAEGQRQIAQDAAQRFEQMSQKLIATARGTSESMNHLFALPSTAEGGLRDMQKSLASMVEGVVQTNLRATQELLRLSNPVAVIELQQRFLSAYMDALMQGTTALVQAIRRTADETLPSLEAQVAQRKLAAHAAQ